MYDVDHVFFCKVSANDLSISSVTTYICIDNNRRVKLFHKGSPVPLPEWIRHGRNTRLSKESILENFPSYVEQLSVNHYCTVLIELQQLKFQKNLKYSADM